MDKGRSQAYAIKVGMTIYKQIIIGYLKNLRAISQIAFHVTHFFEFMRTFIAPCARLAIATERLCARTSSCTFCISFFACDKYPKLMDMAHVPYAEFNYKGTNTNLLSIFENVHRVFEY